MDFSESEFYNEEKRLNLANRVNYVKRRWER